MQNSLHSRGVIFSMCDSVADSNCVFVIHYQSYFTYQVHKVYLIKLYIVFYRLQINLYRLMQYECSLGSGIVVQQVFWGDILYKEYETAPLSVQWYEQHQSHGEEHQKMKKKSDLFQCLSEARILLKLTVSQKKKGKKTQTFQQ